MTALEGYVETTSEAAQGIAMGIVFSALPLLMMGMALGLMRLMINIPMSVLGE